MAIELEFNKDELELSGDTIPYEWVVRQFADRYDLIFHFFLHENKENAKFFKTLTEIVIESGINAEVSYTEDFDGHDLIMCGIQPWQADALKSQVIKGIKNAYPNADKKGKTKG